MYSVISSHAHRKTSTRTHARRREQTHTHRHTNPRTHKLEEPRPRNTTQHVTHKNKRTRAHTRARTYTHSHTRARAHAHIHIRIPGGITVLQTLAQKLVSVLVGIQCKHYDTSWYNNHTNPEANAGIRTDASLTVTVDTCTMAR